jgi:hypothetical protein
VAVAVAIVAERREAEQDIEPGAVAETDLEVEPRRLTEEESEADVGARRGGPPRGQQPENNGR